MIETTSVEAEGYSLPLDRAYDPATRLWVHFLEDGRVRVGFDPLELEVSGTLAQLELAPPGSEILRGEPFGSLEAAKFVGPLLAPVSGTVVARNEAVLADPGRAEQDPLGAGWLVELTPARLEDELSQLLQGEAAVGPWLRERIEEYRLQGSLAE